MMSITFIFLFLSCSQFLPAKRFLDSWIRPHVKNKHQSSLTVSFDSKTRLFFVEMFRKFSTVKTNSFRHIKALRLPFNHCTCTFNERVPCPKLLVIGQRNTNTKHHTRKQKPDVSTEKRKASYKSERMVEPVFSFVWSWVKLAKKPQKQNKKDVRTEKRKSSYKSERMVETVFSFVWSWFNLEKKKRKRKKLTLEQRNAKHHTNQNEWWNPCSRSHEAGSS